MSKVYVYRGLDLTKRPAVGKLLADSQEEAEKQAKSYCSVVEAVYIDQKQPPPGAIEAYREAVQNANQPIHPNPGLSPTGPLTTAVTSVPATPDVAPSGMRTGPVTGDLPAPKQIKPPERTVEQPKPMQKAITEAMKDIKEFENPTEPLDNTYRESILFGDYKSIQNQLDSLLDKQNGSVKAIEMMNDTSGKVVLAVVVKHRRK